MELFRKSYSGKFKSTFILLAILLIAVGLCSIIWWGGLITQAILCFLAAACLIFSLWMDKKFYIKLIDDFIVIKAYWCKPVAIAINNIKYFEVVKILIYKYIAVNVINKEMLVGLPAESWIVSNKKYKEKLNVDLIFNLGYYDKKKEQICEELNKIVQQSHEKTT